MRPSPWVSPQDAVARASVSTSQMRGMGGRDILGSLLFSAPADKAGPSLPTYTCISNIALICILLGSFRTAVPPSRRSRPQRRGSRGRSAPVFGVLCLPTVQSSDIARSVPASGGQDAFLGISVRRGWRMAAEQPHRAPHLVIIAPASLASAQMPPHVQPAPERHGALQVVSDQFAHVATGRHAGRFPR
jgi:hypothetical protein